MTRFSDEPYYNLLSRGGWRDLRFALKYHGLSFLLVQEVFSHTWFGIKFKMVQYKQRKKNANSNSQINTAQRQPEK